MSITIYKENKEIILNYQPLNIKWFEEEKIKGQKYIRIKAKNKELFTFIQKDYLKDLTFKNEEEINKIEDFEPEQFYFVLGELQDNGYFLIEGRKLNVSQNIYIHKDVKVSKRFFIGAKNISIFEKIGNLLYSNDNKEDIYIGGESENRISEKSFLNILKKLPNDYELEKYAENRYAVVLGNYFSFSADIFDKYHKYMNKKESIKDDNLNKAIKEPEIEKYELILDKIKEMLANEDKYNERQWQNEILDIILILFPKYLYAFKEAPVKDFDTGTTRRIDIILVDYNGNVDLIEIKKPQGKSIMMEKLYRSNYLPQDELVGSILQAEKYIFHLSKSGKAGEDRLNKKYYNDLVQPFNIRIKNPHSMIIMGRENNMSVEKKKDFEIIKRKYKNVTDIITYDDLLDRLERLIKRWKTK